MAMMSEVEARSERELLGTAPVGLSLLYVPGDRESTVRAAVVRMVGVVGPEQDGADWHGPLVMVDGPDLDEVLVWPGELWVPVVVDGRLVDVVPLVEWLDGRRGS